MKLKFKYSDRIVYLTPYNSKIERDILLYSSLSEELTLDGCLNILKDNIQCDFELTDTEKIIILYKLRSISIGEEIPIRFVCDNCNAVNEQDINISNLVQDSNITDSLIKDSYKELTEDNFQDFINIDIDELDIDKYDELYERTKNEITKFNLSEFKTCHKCKNSIKIDFSSIKYVIENMSEDTLISLYQCTNDLIFFSHYTRDDVENMLPFERTIFIELLNKTRENLNK